MEIASTYLNQKGHVIAKSRQGQGAFIRKETRMARRDGRTGWSSRPVDRSRVAVIS